MCICMYVCVYVYAARSEPLKTEERENVSLSLKVAQLSLSHPLSLSLSFPFLSATTPFGAGGPAAAYLRPAARPPRPAPFSAFRPWRPVSFSCCVRQVPLAIPFPSPLSPPSPWRRQRSRRRALATRGCDFCGGWKRQKAGRRLFIAYCVTRQGPFVYAGVYG